MSVIIKTTNPDVPNEILEYAYTRADTNGETVVIYRRLVVSSGFDHYEYIATGVDSDRPLGSEVFMAIGRRSPLYDLYI